MRFTVPLILCASLAVTGCARVADSRLNPLNWFGASAPVSAVAADGTRRALVSPGDKGQVVDARGLIAQITAMSVDRTPDGAIVHATGVAAIQGQFNAQLVILGTENGTLLLAFKVQTPAGAQTVGTAASRQITVARALDIHDLAGIRRIQVQAAGNARTVSR